MDAGTITDWFSALQGGDRAAAQQLWERYFAAMVGLARKHLRNAPRRAADEEDVALSAFDSFCRGAEGGRFARLNDRDDLWRLLVVITTRKAVNQRQHEGRQKRGGGRTPVADTDCLDAVLGREPTPELAAQVADEYRRLMATLDDDELRQKAQMKMEGYTNDEIAERLGLARRTVQRRLTLIQDIWRQELV